MLGIGIAGGGRCVAERMADDPSRSGCRSRGACRTETRDQARQRNRIGRRQRNNAPPQRPPGEILAHGASPRQPLCYITKVARLSLYEPELARFIPVTEASVQRCLAAGSARPELVAGQHGADGFDQLRLRHRALRLGLLLQMLLAAFFELGELGADDEVFDYDLWASGIVLFVGALDDDARRVAAVGVFHLWAEFARTEIKLGADAGIAQRRNHLLIIGDA